MTFGAGPAFVENLWAKGRRMRAESVVEGRRILTFVDEQALRDRRRPRAAPASRSSGARHSIAQDAKRTRPFGTELDEIVKNGGEKVGAGGARRAGRRPLPGHARRRRPRRGLGDDRREPPADRVGLPRPRQRRDEPPRLPALGARRSSPTTSSSPTRDVKLESMTYEEYVARSKKGPVGPAPPFFSDLLHGARES